VPGVVIGVPLVVALGAGVVLLGSQAGRWFTAGARTEPEPQVGKAKTEADRVCERFMALKNARDSAALELLGVAPAVPDRELTKEEADRLQTDLFLRQDVRVVEVRRDRRAQKDGPTKSPYCVLVTQGQVTAPDMTVTTPKGPERGQRFMSNPDLVVEVRDGKIYGVEARLHMD
jgi:hypothetical protein